MREHINFLIIGNVHGVGFRFSCMEMAYKCNIKGNVRNNDDGTVYIEAEGLKPDLEAFRDWCKKGPAYARVVKVEETIGDLKNYDSFDIKKK